MHHSAARDRKQILSICSHIFRLRRRKKAQAELLLLLQKPICKARLIKTICSQCLSRDTPDPHAHQWLWVPVVWGLETSVGHVRTIFSVIGRGKFRFFCLRSLFLQKLKRPKESVNCEVVGFTAVLCDHVIGSCWFWVHFHFWQEKTKK